MPPKGGDIDRTPPAVIIAKANYLLAVGELAKLGEKPLFVPVYLANSIILPELRRELFYPAIEVYPVPVGREVYPIPRHIADDSELLDKAIQAVQDYAVTLATGQKDDDLRFDRILTASLRLSAGLEEAEKRDIVRCLHEVARKLAKAIKERRDTIHAFVLKDINRPLFLKERADQTGFDALVGNPPWLSFRYIVDTQYQAELKKLMSSEYRLLIGKLRPMAQIELATLFLVRCSDLYLKRGGHIPSASLLCTCLGTPPLRA